MTTDNADKYNRLWTKSLNFGIMQIENEIISFMKFLDERIKIDNLLEIGICHGATFFIWSALASERGIKLGVDFVNSGNFGHTRPLSSLEMAAKKHNLMSMKPNTHVFFGNSRDIHTQDWVRSRLDGKQLDFLFIDGDHSYEGAKSDFEIYGPLVRKGGIIALHDIKDSVYHKKCNCNVYKLWNEIQGEKYEFKSPAPVDDDMDLERDDFGGIGALIKE